MKILLGVLWGLLWFAGAAWSGNFTDNQNGTVADNATGLVWQQEDDNTTRNWEAAISYCENLTLAGQADWRLPNVKELKSLVDWSRYNPAIDPVAFPGTNSADYWTSTTSYAYGNGCAWEVYFYYGEVYDGGGKSQSRYVRCVR